MAKYVIEIEQKEAKNACLLSGYLKELAPVPVRGKTKRYVCTENVADAYVFNTRGHAEQVLMFGLRPKSFVQKGTIVELDIVV